MEKISIPTLTDRKFDTDINNILLKIYQYYVTSDYGQTLSYYGYVKSLRASLKKADYKPESVKETIYEDLSDILYNYFGNNAEVEVDVKETKKDNRIYYIVYINLTVNVDGKTYILNNKIESSDLKDLTFNDYLDYLLQGGPDEN